MLAFLSCSDYMHFFKYFANLSFKNGNKENTSVDNSCELKKSQSILYEKINFMGW
jgi:hypothetical protein